MTTVLLVDDQELVRSGFRVILGLSESIEVTGEAASGEQAVARARELHPDVVCMDVQMPGMDGLDATRAIVADPELDAAVLILTTFDRDDYLYQALRSGASGFLLKNSSPEQLTEAVRIVAAGDALLSPEVTKRVIARFAARAETTAGPAGPDSRLTAAGAESGTAHADQGRALDCTAADPGAAPVIGLTDRETEVLGLLGQGLSNAEIAAALVVGEATVKTHVSNILAKLQLRDRIQAVVYAYEHRIVTPSD
jgi:DNA-binding NarL/FixJ family response regulator